MSERRKRADPARLGVLLLYHSYDFLPPPQKIIAFQHCHTAALAIQGIKAI